MYAWLTTFLQPHVQYNSLFIGRFVLLSSFFSLLPTDLLVHRQLWSVAALIIKLSSLPEISEMSQAC